MAKHTELAPADLLHGIRNLLLTAKAQVRQTVNTAMVQTYWQVGRLIVEDEQGGERRAAYGSRVLMALGQRLSEEFGAGFSHTNLKLFRQFYSAFPNGHTLCDQSALGRLSWSHFRQLLRVSNPTARDWYANEAAQQGWSVRALDRQIGTLFYERLLSTQDQAKASVHAEAAVNIAKESPPRGAAPHPPPMRPSAGRNVPARPALTYSADTARPPQTARS